jgi:exosortase/archaeosortase family protein
MAHRAGKSSPAVQPAADEGRPARRFALLFAAFSGLFFAWYFVYTLPLSGWPYRRFVDYLEGYAATAGTVLHLLDSSVRVSGTTITGRRSLAIVRGCDGSEILILFTAAVLASHMVRWRARIVGIVVGVLALSLANLARICSLYFVEVYWPSQTDVWHFELWPLILIACAVSLFVLWRRWADRPGQPTLS